MLGEQATGDLFRYGVVVCGLFVVYSGIYLVWRRRLPIYPLCPAIAVSIVYLILYIPLMISNTLVWDFMSWPNWPPSHPYTALLMLLHWPVMEFIVWAAYTGRKYIDTPLLWPVCIWEGGICFYFYGTIVVLGVARLVDRGRKALRRHSS